MPDMARRDQPELVGFLAATSFQGRGSPEGSHPASVSDSVHWGGLHVVMFSDELLRPLLS
jgi:hypothetical protein